MKPVDVTVTRLPDGGIYIAFPPVFVGTYKRLTRDDPEVKDLLEIADTVLQAGNESN